MRLFSLLKLLLLQDVSIPQDSASSNASRLRQRFLCRIFKFDDWGTAFSCISNGVVTQYPKVQFESLSPELDLLTEKWSTEHALQISLDAFVLQL